MQTTASRLRLATCLAMLGISMLEAGRSLLLMCLLLMLLMRINDDCCNCGLLFVIVFW